MEDWRHVIGLMSGTSCDGIDAALVRISGSGGDMEVRLLDFRTLVYTDELRSRLLARHKDAETLCLLNFELGELLAKAATEMMGGAKVDFIASHGHTIAHHPPGEENRFVGTLQIGESAIVAERTGVPVVSDFRPRDMAAGGQGAPLVPYADWVLFSKKEITTACLNIGGIANVTVVPPELERVEAFDTGPGNMIIDGAVRLMTNGDQQMDESGEAASRGQVIDELLDLMLGHPYLDAPPPKSAGREQFGMEEYLAEPLGRFRDRSMEDIAATVTAVVHRSIAGAMQRFVLPRFEVTRLVVSGGGAHNKTLLNGIAGGLPGIEVLKSDALGVPGDAKEAIAFAILGNETMRGLPSNVPSATGAKRAVVLGQITFA